MKTFLRRFENNRELIVLFGTWGMDEKAFSNLCTDKFDFILYYNYSADAHSSGDENLQEGDSHRMVTWSPAAEYYSR
jgi:hypothetical protein